MLIIIKTWSGRKIYLNVDSDNKIEYIKEKLEEEVGFPPNKQKLIFNEQTLENDKTLSFYQINDQCIINFFPILIDVQSNDDNNNDDIDLFSENKENNNKINIVNNNNIINNEENNIINTNISHFEENENENQILIKKKEEDLNENFFIKNYLKRNELYINLIHFDLKMTKKDNYKYFNDFQIDIFGYFHAFDDLSILQNYLDKMKNKDIPFIVISSGTSGKDVIEICLKYSFIKEVIIFCGTYEYNEHYLKEYPDYVKKVFIKSKELIDYLKSLDKDKYKNGVEKYLDENKYIFRSEDRQMQQSHIISSYEYDRCYFLVHKIYSDFFGDINNKNEISLFKKENLEKIIEYLSSLNFQDDNEKNLLINRFNNLSDLETNNQFIEQSIKEYMNNESSFCFIFNRKLNNFEKWIIPFSFYMGPFLYGLYKYTKDNPDFSISKKITLYKIFKSSKLDFYQYKYNLGHIICLTSLTLTSSNKIKYDPKKYNQKIDDNIDENVIVKLIFTYNYKKGCLSPGIVIGDKKLKDGSYLSNNPKEKEVILFPFTFAKINKIKIETENKTKIYMVELEIINRNSYIEYTLKNDFENRILFNKMEEIKK